MVFRWVYGRIMAEPEFAGIPNPEPRRRDLEVRQLRRPLLDETQVERSQARRWVWIGALAVFAGYLVVVGEATAVRQWWRAGAGESMEAFSAALSEGLRSVGIAVSLLVLVADVGMMFGLLWLVARVLEAISTWTGRVEALVRPRLRSLINAELNLLMPDRLSASSARGLADADEPAYWIERRGMARIVRLVTELGATVIGVSGGRGIGKTTLLRRTIASLQPPMPADPRRKVNAPKTPLSVLVEAPVDYAPREFLLDMYGQLCETVIAADEHQRKRVPSAAGPVAGRVVRGIARVICAVVGISYLVEIVPTDESGVRHVPDLATELVKVVGLDTQIGDGAKFLVLGGFVAAYVALGQIGRGLGSLARQAEAELSRIHYLQTLQNERNLSVAGRFGLGLSARRARQLAQQPMTLPELVRRFRAFAGKVAESSRDANGLGLVIAVDELDRIADPQAAEMLLNQVKATFRVPGCIYLISVSEEALAQFERRISTARTAVDTAFDEVVWLPELSLQESIALLERRVTGFPRAFLALCHCLSGGIPRDLVRAARSLIDTGNDELEPLVRAVISNETTAYLRGVLRDLQQPTTAKQDSKGVLSEESILRLLLDDATTAESQIHLAASTLRARGGRWSSEISAVLSYYAAVEELFVDQFDVVQAAIAEPPDQASVGVIESLTSVRASLSLSPDLAAEKLTALRTANSHFQP
jgi:hypothetical protein